MESAVVFLGIGFLLLCYYWGKAELLAQRTTSHLALLALLPEEERMARVRELLEKQGRH
jgi:hypothetical protein